MQYKFFLADPTPGSSSTPTNQINTNPKNDLTASSAGNCSKTSSSALASPTKHLGFKIGLIGPGKVGRTLKLAFEKTNHQVLGLAGRQDLELQTKLTKTADILFLTVPDAVILPLAQQLAEEVGFHPGQIVIHCAGVHGLEVLQPAAKQGALTAALHPIFSFLGTPSDLPLINGVSWAITTEERYQHFFSALVLELEGQPFTLAAQDRALYHALLTHGANHLNTLVNQCVKGLTALGLENSTTALAPLLEVSLQRALQLGVEGLTGPASRGDAATIAAHMRALKILQTADNPLQPSNTPNLLESYQALAKATAQQCYQRGKLNETATFSVLDALEM